MTFKHLDGLHNKLMDSCSGINHDTLSLDSATGRRNADARFGGKCSTLRNAGFDRCKCMDCQGIQAADNWQRCVAASLLN